VIGTDCIGSCKSSYHTIMTPAYKRGMITVSCTKRKLGNRGVGAGCMFSHFLKAGGTRFNMEPYRKCFINLPWDHRTINCDVSLYGPFEFILLIKYNNCKKKLNIDVYGV